MKTESKKPVVIFIYGPIAAGKLTVARELEKITGFKLVHNHTIIDFTKNIFPEHKSRVRRELQESLFFDVVSGLVKDNKSIIMTYAYAKVYVSETGLSDPDFVKKIKNIAQKKGAQFYPVQLVAHEGEILKRITSASRKKFKKLMDVKIMKELMKREDMYTPASFKNNLSIDNTKISAKKVAKKIVEHFKL